MNPRLKPVKRKIIAVIFIDVFLFFLLVLASYAFFSKPARAENVEFPSDSSSANLTFASELNVDGNASSEINNSEGKVFVCKYVGTPGVDERLQTGDNPISVSITAIPDYQGIGSWFADQQGRSYVLAEDVGQPEPPVTDCPPVGTTTPTATVTENPTPTNTTMPSATSTLEPSPTNTVMPSATSSLEPSPTNTVKPSTTSTLGPSPTLKPTNTKTSTIQPSPTHSPSITPSPTATSSMEEFTCTSCSIVKDFRDMIVSGLYTADLLNTEDISSTFKVSITLFDVYKRVVVGETIEMTDTQPANEVMQVNIPLWCLNPVEDDVYWFRTIASAQKSTGETWFVLDEWVRYNPTDETVYVP